MSIYPDKKNGKLTGRWYVEVQIKGQRKRGRFNTMEDAKRAEARFRTELASGDTVGATLRTDRVAPETLAHLWAKASEMMWRDNRHGKLSRAKLAWILQEIGDFRLHSIPADYGDRLIRRLEEDGKKPGTVNRYIAAISAVLHWGMRRGYVQFTPAFDMRREERGRTRWLTNEEEYQLISTLRAFDYADVADLCIVAIDTGCRLGELLGVQHQLNGDRLHLRKPKTTNHGPPAHAPRPGDPRGPPSLVDQREAAPHRLGEGQGRDGSEPRQGVRLSRPAPYLLHPAVPNAASDQHPDHQEVDGPREDRDDDALRPDRGRHAGRGQGHACTWCGARA